jgi:hypothetical protein
MKNVILDGVVEEGESFEVEVRKTKPGEHSLYIHANGMSVVRIVKIKSPIRLTTTE